MDEFTILVRNILVVPTGLYLLSSSVSAAVNPYNTIIKMVFWSFGVLIALSMLTLPFANKWLVTLIK